MVEVELETGRTHRFACTQPSLGYPVMGDRRYGNDTAEADRLHLHAWRLQFEHPLQGQQALDLTAALPAWAQAANDASDGQEAPGPSRPVEPNDAQ